MAAEDFLETVNKFAQQAGFKDAQSAVDFVRETGNKFMPGTDDQPGLGDTLVESIKKASQKPQPGEEAEADKDDDPQFLEIIIQILRNLFNAGKENDLNPEATGQALTQNVSFLQNLIKMQAAAKPGEKAEAEADAEATADATPAADTAAETTPGGNPAADAEARADAEAAPETTAAEDADAEVTAAAGPRPTPGVEDDDEDLDEDLEEDLEEELGVDAEEAAADEAFDVAMDEDPQLDAEARAAADDVDPGITATDPEAVSAQRSASTSSLERSAELHDDSARSEGTAADRMNPQSILERGPQPSSGVADEAEEASAGLDDSGPSLGAGAGG